MSAPAPERRRREKRSGCAVLFMTIVGLVLMLPAMCSVVFMSYLKGGGDLELLWAITFLFAAVGLSMIIFAASSRAGSGN